MLSRNDQLVPEGHGRRQQSRGTVYVDEPPYGFFIAGSSLKRLNGVYIRRNVPSSLAKAREGERVLLYYEACEEHNSSSMLLVETVVPPPPEEEEYYDEDEDEEEAAARRWYSQRIPPPKPKREWLIVDERKVDRFTHGGDTIVPGAGVRWKHVHKKSGSTAAPAAAAAAGGAMRIGGGGGGGLQLAEVKPDDDDELPWQVIAILDTGILQQLIGGARYHAHKCAEAKAGRGDAVKQPPHSSLECLSASIGSKWLYRVVGAGGVTLRTLPSLSSQTLGRRLCGDYIKGLEVKETPTGQWLKIDTSAEQNRAGEDDDDDEEEEEDEEDDFDEDEDEEDEEDEDGVEDEDEGVGQYGFGYRGGRGGGGLYGQRFYNQEHKRKPEAWVQVNEGDVAFLAKVDAVDYAHLSGVAVEGEMHTDDASATPSRRLESLAAEFLDAPYVPRIEVAEGGGSGSPSASSSSAPSTVDTFTDGGKEEATLLATAVAQSTSCVPVGAVVVVIKLGGVDTVQYNGVHGVVTSPLSPTGRQGVRLDAPFSGKVILVRPSNISIPRAMAAGVVEQVPAAMESVARNARVLGLTLKELGLLGSPTGEGEGAAGGGGGGDAFGDGVPLGFRIGCGSASDALAASLRAAQRDSLRDESASSTALSAYQALLTLVKEKEEGGGEGTPEDRSKRARVTTQAFPPFHGSPDVLVRHGSLGPRAAAAARAAVSPTSVKESNSGLSALREVLLEELERSAASGSIAESDDALRLRVTLSLSYLAMGKDDAALTASKDAVESHPAAPASHFVLARCLLRIGKRSEAKTALECAANAGVAATATATSMAEDVTPSTASEAPSPSPSSSSSPSTPDATWARDASGVALRAMKAAERRQVAAADAYERGNFAAAAAAYKEALACIEAGARDDKHGRAALHNNVAACLRRAKEPEAAVAACDAALTLLPRFRRALLRKAVCLLEAGKPGDSVAAFEALYRVDRDWPRLSDWLLRAHAAHRRQKAGGGGGGSQTFEERSPSGGGGGGGGGGGVGPSSSPSKSPNTEADDIAKLAAEKDLYVVLGVTVDATEKQIKSAYRMRSLKYHPDRAGADCTAAFQRIAHAFDVLSDPDKRSNYDQGGDVKASRKNGRDDDSEEEAEEHKQTFREEIERKYYPELYAFLPFGDPFVHKRKLEAQKRNAAGKKQWFEEDG